jgi:hypothetical protein
MVDGVIEPPIQNAPADWRPHLTDDLKADPVVSKWAEKASEKDIPSLVKGYAHLSSRMGSAINLPGKDAKPEDVAALRTKLYEAGVFTPPPADIKGYGVLKPEGLPEGLQWSDELSTKFATALHKHGAPKELAADLMALHLEALGGMTKTLKTDRDAALASLKSEYGEKYDERVEMVKRMMSGIFTTPEELDFAEQIGLADHPQFLSVMLRLAPLAMQDSSFMDTLSRKGGEMSGADAEAEYAKVMNDPKHPHYEGFKRHDPAAEAYVNELFRKAYGTEKVTIGQGVGIAGIT